MEMTVNKFLKSMAEAGFNGSFRATNGELTYHGTIDNGKISTVKVRSVAESKQKIQELLNDNKTNKAWMQ